MTSQATGQTVRKSVVVAVPPERAFKGFTEGIGGWWPLGSHSFGGERSQGAVLEGRRGGRLYERHADGGEADWGEVLEWEPPGYVAFSWTITRPATEVRVRFSPEGDGTRVELEHLGWEAFGAEGEGPRQSYESGWDLVLGRYTEAV